MLHLISLSIPTLTCQSLKTSYGPSCCGVDTPLNLTTVAWDAPLFDALRCANTGQFRMEAADLAYTTSIPMDKPGGATRTRFSAPIVDDDYVYGTYNYCGGPDTLLTAIGGIDVESISFWSAGRDQGFPSSLIESTVGVRSGVHSGAARTAAGDTYVHPVFGEQPRDGLETVLREHGEGCGTLLYKVDKCSGQVVDYKTLAEIAKDINVGYPRAISIARCPSDADGACVGRELGALVNTREIIASKDGKHLYTFSGNTHTPTIAKIAKKDFTLVWSESIDDFFNTMSDVLDDHGNPIPQRMNEAHLKNIHEIENLRGERLILVTSSPHSMGYEANFRQPHFEAWGPNFFKHGTGAVFAFRDEGERAVRQWTFKTCAERLNGGDALPAEVFPPDASFFRAWYPANHLEGKALSASTAMGDDATTAVHAKITDTSQRILFGELVLDGIDEHTQGSYRQASSSYWYEASYIDALVGYISFSAGVLDRTTTLDVYSDYARTVRHTLPDNHVGARVEQLRDANGLPYFTKDAQNHTVMKASFLIDRQHPVIVRMGVDQIGKTLDAPLAANLNYYGAGVWSKLSYDPVTDSIIGGGGNAYRLPLEDEIRYARAKQCIPEADVPEGAEGWSDCEVLTGYKAPPTLGPYGEEVDLWVESFDDRIGFPNRGDPEKASLDRDVSYALAKSKNVSDPESLAAYYAARSAQHDRMRSVGRSARSHRTLIDGYFSLGSDGHLRSGWSAYPYDAYSNIIHNDGFVRRGLVGNNLMSIIAGGMNNDYGGQLIHSDTLTVFMQVQRGKNMILDLQAPAAVQCAPGSDTTCNRGIATSNVEDHLVHWDMTGTDMANHFASIAPFGRYFASVDIPMHLLSTKSSLLYSWDPLSNELTPKYATLAEAEAALAQSHPDVQVRAYDERMAVFMEDTGYVGIPHGTGPKTPVIISVHNAKTGDVVFEVWARRPDDVEFPGFPFGPTFTLGHGNAAFHPTVVGTKLVYPEGGMVTEVDLVSGELDFLAVGAHAVTVRGGDMWVYSQNENAMYPSSAPTLHKYSVA